MVGASMLYAYHENDITPSFYCYFILTVKFVVIEICFRGGIDGH